MLPAFGRELLELRLDGKRPGQPVYVVGNWSLARQFRARQRFALMAELVPERPNEHLPPKRFDFSMLRDLDVVIVPDSLEWLGTIRQQVRWVRPASVNSDSSFWPHLQTAAEKADLVMTRFDPQWVAEWAELNAAAAAWFSERVEASKKRVEEERQLEKVQA